MRKPYIFLVSVLLISSNAVSQSIDSLTIDDYYIDYSVPDLSSLGMLGIESNEIVRPGNLKEFAAAISNFVDSDGSIKPALAMEWSFLKTFSKKDPVNWNVRAQPRNIALSIATTNQDSLGLRIGMGIKWVPFDNSDPIGDNLFYNKISTLAASYWESFHFKKIDEFDILVYNSLNISLKGKVTEEELVLYKKIISVLDVSTASLKKYRKNINEGVDIDSLLQEKLVKPIKNSIWAEEIRNTLIKKFKEILLHVYSNSYISYSDFIEQLMEKELELYKKNNWNKFAIEVSAGWVGHSTTSTYDDFTNEKFSMFGGVSFPSLSIKKAKSQLIIQLKYDLDASSDSINYDRFSIGAKHLLGTSDNRFSLELLYSNAETNLLETNQLLPVSYLRYTAGFEVKLTDGTWLELAFGGQKFFEGKNEKNAILANFGFKHAINAKPRYKLN